MSSATVSSSSPSPGGGPSIIKRTHTDSVDIEERNSKKPKMTLEDANAKRDAKDKKRRKGKRKKKVSVVVAEGDRSPLKDFRRGISGALIIASSPMKAGESSRNSLEPVVLVDVLEGERDVEAIVSSNMDKGKGKATEAPAPDDLGLTAIQDKGKGETVDLPTAEEQIARLTAELTFKNELIEKHQAAVAQTQQAITCQVCLELMYKPFALSPCGHLACYDCLVSWFKAPPPEQEYPSLPPIAHRKKTCPHCRATVKERPVQVWGVKDIVDSFAKSGLLQGNFLAPDETNANVNGDVDPWDGIFLKLRRHDHGNDSLGFLDYGIRGPGFRDDEDGGVYRCYDCLHEIWDGVCSNCGRVYADDGEDDEDFDIHDLGSEDDDDDDDDFPGGWMRGPNPHLGSDLLRHMEAAIAGHHNFMPGQPPGAWIEDDVEDEMDDEGEGDTGYESSFIDDDHDVGIPRGSIPSGSRYRPHVREQGNVIELSSGSDDDEGPMYRRRRPHTSSDNPVEVSDNEDDIREVREPARSHRQAGRRVSARPTAILSDDDEDAPGPSTRRRGVAPTITAGRNRHIVLSTDEEDNLSDDGVDPDLADRVAAHEHDLYGDDGSVPSRRGGRRADTILVDDEELSPTESDDQEGSEDEDEEEMYSHSGW